MERNSFSFLKQFLDAVDTEDFTYEERCQATYALCYFAIRGELPQEASAMDKMHVRNNVKLLEGQDTFKNKKSVEGTIGGSNGASVSDEAIIEAYAKLYYKLGRHPKEQEVIQELGANVQRIGGRKVWKTGDKNQWIEMYRDVYGIQKNVQDVHVYTSEDF